VFVRPLSRIFFCKIWLAFKNASQFSASRIFSAEFRLTYLRLIFRLSRFFKKFKVNSQCFINHARYMWLQSLANLLFWIMCTENLTCNLALLKFSDNHCKKVQSALSISVSECSKSTERATAVQLRGLQIVFNSFSYWAQWAVSKESLAKSKLSCTNNICSSL